MSPPNEMNVFQNWRNTPRAASKRYRLFLTLFLTLFAIAPTNASMTWTEDTSVGASETWRGITSSSDGTKLAAVVYNGNIWTSTDSGATWTSVGATQTWDFITSSSDGTKLAATVKSGKIWTSTDSGATWTSRATTQNGMASPPRATAPSSPRLLITETYGPPLILEQHGPLGQLRKPGVPSPPRATAPSSPRLSITETYGPPLILEQHGPLGQLRKPGVPSPPRATAPSSPRLSITERYGPPVLMARIRARQHHRGLHLL